MKKKRIVMSALGVFLLAVGVSITKTAAMGVDPYQSLVSGLDLLLPFGFGNIYLCLNLLFLIFDLLVDRSHIGVATFINLFFLGHIAQFGYDMLCIPAYAYAAIAHSVFSTWDRCDLSGFLPVHDGRFGGFYL